MDYQGNYFPEDRDERESKVYRTVKNIFKWTMYGISFVIYAIIFYMLIVNRDSDILETNYMAELPQYENIDTDDITLYRINPQIFMNEDGALQVYNVDYSDEHGFLELGLKFNAKKMTDGDNGDTLYYVLYDSNENIYPVEYYKTDSGGRYGFTRICFSGLDIDLDSNDLRYDPENASNTRTVTAYHLSVYRKSDDKLLFDFDIYNNSVTFNKTDYDE